MCVIWTTVWFFLNFLPAFVVTIVLHSAHSTVGLMQGVFPLNDVTVAAFVLGLDVVGVGVFHFISELVLGMRLKKMNSTLKYFQCMNDCNFFQVLL